MGWLYVPESEVSNSASNSPAQTPALCATLSTTGTPCESCAGASQQATSTTRPSGMTSELLTGFHGVDAWISSLRDTRASQNQLPVNASDTMTSDGYGPISGASFAKWNPDTSSWRTSQLTFPGLGDESSVTWPRAGGVSNGTAYLRLPLALRTSAIVYSLSLHEEWLQNMVLEGRLAMLASSGLLPTPTRGDSNGSGSAGYSTASGRSEGTTLSDSIDGPRLGRSMERRLNPAFVEWMLGLPVEWTS